MRLLLFVCCLTIVHVAVVIGHSIPIKGFQVVGQFLCNGLPLVGTEGELVEGKDCSNILLNLRIPNRQIVINLLEPFASMNVSYHLSCGQLAHKFTASQPVITVIHNCVSQPSEADEEGTEVVAAAECKRWVIQVPSANVGGENGTLPPILELGTQELSEHGQPVDCQVSLSSEVDTDLNSGSENDDGTNDGTTTSESVD